MKLALNDIAYPQQKEYNIQLPIFDLKLKRGDPYPLQSLRSDCVKIAHNPYLAYKWASFIQNQKQNI